MWRNIKKADEKAMSQFERHFDFAICDNLRGFLIEHNGGSTTPCAFQTDRAERKLVRLFDFSQPTSSAWEINERLRDQIGTKRIIIGADQKGNFVCVEREYSRQTIVVWSHVSGLFESCLLSIPAFLRAIN